MASTRNVLGRGLQFPLALDGRGGLSIASDEERVATSIRLILGTAKGERVMRPEFGCDIHRFAFETLDRTNLTLIQSSVREALVRWEPRIEVLEVRVGAGHGQSGRIDIEIGYRVRATNGQFNLVYPFYLREAAR